MPRFFIKYLFLLLTLGVVLAGGGASIVCVASADGDLRRVPGVVIHHEPAPGSIRLPTAMRPWVYGRPRVYVTSGSIVVLPTGHYLATGNIFGPDSGAHLSGSTFVYESMDKGRSWRFLTELSGMKRGSLFLIEERIWAAQGPRLMSAPVTADLLCIVSLGPYRLPPIPVLALFLQGVSLCWFTHAPSGCNWSNGKRRGFDSRSRWAHTPI